MSEETRHVDVGRAFPVVKGAWADNADYEVMDIVSYAGSGYIAKQDVPAGIMPGKDDDYWCSIAATGVAATIEIGSVSRIPAGFAPFVVNSGDEQNAVLNFGLPEGNGIAAFQKTGTNILTDTYRVTFTDPEATAFTFQVQNGRGVSSVEKASVGLVDTYTITYNDGSVEYMTVTNGQPCTHVWNGTTLTVTSASGTSSADLKGQAATIAAGTVTTLPAGSLATVTNSGTSGDGVFDFGIPQGEKGDKGDQGDSIIPGGVWDSSMAYDPLSFVTKDGAAYIALQSVPAGTAVTNTDYWMKSIAGLSIGTVTTVAYDAGASATITGTPDNPVLNLSIPRGAAGNESIDDNAGAGDDDVVWSADKLTKTMTQRKSTLSANTDLSTLYSPGIYVKKSNVHVDGAPSIFTDSSAYLLLVLSAFYAEPTSSSDLIFQILIPSNPDYPIYRRRYNHTSGWHAWVRPPEINDSKGMDNTDYVWSADKSFKETDPLNKFIIEFIKSSDNRSVTTVGTTQKYWNCETSTAVLTSVSDSSFRAFDPVTVSEGEIYTILSKSGSTHKARPWLITDDDYNIIASSGDQYGADKKYYIIVVPEGGTKLLLTTASLSNPDLKRVDYQPGKSMEYEASLSALEVTKLSDCKESGWYGCGAAYSANITDLPKGFTSSALHLLVMSYAFNSGNDINNPLNNIILQILFDGEYRIFQRIIYRSTGTVDSWVPIRTGRYNNLIGKKVAIIGDSISTNGTAGENSNVPEITIEEEDVGVELNAWLTYYDVDAGLSLGGHTFTTNEIGTKVTFTPTAEDVGKVIGLSNNYNDASVIVWWEEAMRHLIFKPIPVCWSGSSITSHEGNKSEYKTSYAWHESQIRKCGIRTPGTMTRTDPDVVIIYRGANDMTHSHITPFAADVVLTEGYFDNYNWQYPENDTVEGGYGFKEGMCLTIKKIREAYPKAKIFLCTLNVLKRINYSHFPTNNGVNSLPQYNKAIREVAEFMGCGLIEFDKDGITFENCSSEAYLKEATAPTHPTDKGHRVMGRKAVADLLAQYSPMN